MVQFLAMKFVKRMEHIAVSGVTAATMMMGAVVQFYVIISYYYSTNICINIALPFLTVCGRYVILLLYSFTMCFLFIKEILVMASAGLVLILLRKLFILLIPDIIIAADYVADKLTTVWRLLATIFYGIRFSFYIAFKLLSVITLGAVGSPNIPAFGDAEVVSADRVVRILTRIVVEDTNYNSLGKILRKILPAAFSHYVCPYIRATYPLGPHTWYKAAMTLLGFLSYDSVPYPGNNCAVPTDVVDWIMVGMFTILLSTPYSNTSMTVFLYAYHTVTLNGYSMN